MFVFQAGYALAEGAWFWDGFGRHWLGFPPVSAAVSGGLSGGALGLVTTWWRRPLMFLAACLGLIASCRNAGATASS
jgi:hypothetical protein